MNNKAFKHKVLPLSVRIYPMAARMLQDEEEARDAVQEIMIKLWNLRQQLAKHPNIAGFVFLTARNYCLDQIRKRNIAEANQAYQELIADVYDDQSINDFKELSKIVLQIIGTLPENQKEVMQLRDLDGFEFEEIAAMTKLKIEHIRVLLSRARKYVRLELEKYIAMNQEETKKLLELYEQGLTSSEEETALIKTLGDSKNDKHIWFKFLKNHKNTTPANLENQIWSNIHRKEKKYPKIIFRALAVAATITLIITILWFPNPIKSREMSYEEKAAVLKEVLTMISYAEERITEHEIIYEDETIIIYTEK